MNGYDKATRDMWIGILITTIGILLMIIGQLI